MTQSIPVGTEPPTADVAVPPPHRQTSADGTARRRWKLIVGRVGVLVVVLLLWQLVAGRLVDTFYLPQPTRVVAELWTWAQDGSLFGHIAATLVPAAQGFLIGSSAALLLGYVLAMAKSAAGILEPYIAGLYGIPIIALVPLMILWFGIGRPLAVSVAAIASFFLMFFNAYFGIRDVSQSLINQVTIAGGSKWDIAWRVRLPSALVWVVAGMKVAVPHSIVGVVVAEFLTGSEGLGFLLSYNANQFNTVGTFAAVFTLAALSFIVDRLMFLVTKRPLMWKEANQSG